MKKAILLTLFLVGCSNPEKAPEQTVAKLPEALPAKQSPEAELQIEAALKSQPSVAPDQISLNLKRGQTLEKLLSPYGLDSKDIFDISNAIRPYLPPNRMKIGQQFDLQMDKGAVSRVSVKSDFDTMLHLVRSKDSWKIVKEKLATKEQLRSASGTIDGSLYIAATQQHVPHDVINRFILTFSHFVDFQREIQKGDSFRMVYTLDCLVDDETSHQVSRLDYAELTLSGKTTRLYNFKQPDGSHAFYDEQGRLARSFLLKTPVDGARLSSNFGRRRHPILGYSRSHNGIDFGAPLGTPIMAAGNGSVEFAGRNGSFGNMVKLKHEHGYETLYAHMKGFAKGLSEGQQVKQGEIIGYVGNTGLSQSRHLHYEVHKYGKPVNPLTLKLGRQSNVKLQGEALAQFVAFEHQMQSHFLVDEQPLTTQVAD